MSKAVEKSFSIARDVYGALGVDVEKALSTLSKISISLPCWVADDVAGFEAKDSSLSGSGLAVTGGLYPPARNADEIRRDADEAYKNIPGKHRFALHCHYAETGGKKVERSDILPKHFQAWVDWAKAQGLGLDFNSTYFSHPKAASGFTLSDADAGIRKYWIDVTKASRRISEYFGKSLKTPCVHNIWLQDGFKDTPTDRFGPRKRLMESLDASLTEKMSPKHILDSVECKLFGIGTESYVVGSHEFYLGYAVSRKVLITFDVGHFHPTETLADKLSSTLLYAPGILLHASRGVRWDSDHVVTLTDDLIATCTEVIRGGFLDRVHFALDFFDPSINRVAEYVIGARSMQKAILIALLEPTKSLRDAESKGDYTRRLGLMEEYKRLPWGAVYDQFCLQNNVPVGPAWIDGVEKYGRDVLSKRR